MYYVTIHTGLTPKTIFGSLTFFNGVHFATDRAGKLDIYVFHYIYKTSNFAIEHIDSLRPRLYVNV